LAPTLLVLLVVGVSLVPFGLIGLYLSYPHYRAWAAVTAFGVVLALLRPACTRFRFRDLPVQPSDLELVVHESGVEVRTPETINDYRWSNFSHFDEKNKYFVLFLAKDLLLLPKRAFSDQELAAVRKLLQRNLAATSGH
jgi:hypothetical protein